MNPMGKDFHAFPFYHLCCMSTEQIWAEYADELLRYFHMKVGDRDLALDLRQDVFLKVHNNISSLKNTDKAQHWLRVIARNVLMDHWQKTKKTPIDAAYLSETEDDLRFYAKAESCVHQLLEVLPEKYRTPLQLADLDHVPQKEVAEALKLTLSNTKSRIQRGREKLLAAITTCCHIELNKRGEPVTQLCDTPACACCS